MYSLDASTIDLCLSIFPWTKFRNTKGVVKLHAAINHDGYLPSFIALTEGLIHIATVRGGRANARYSKGSHRGGLFAFDEPLFFRGSIDR